MSKTTFKAGDKVRFIGSNDHPSFTKGKVYTTLYTQSTLGELCIAQDDEGDNFWQTADDFEPVSSDRYLVVLVETASSQRRVFDSRKEAEDYFTNAASRGTVAFIAKVEAEVRVDAKLTEIA
jgi:hypothetical protein